MQQSSYPASTSVSHQLLPSEICAAAATPAINVPTTQSSASKTISPSVSTSTFITSCTELTAATTTVATHHSEPSQYQEDTASASATATITSTSSSTGSRPTRTALSCETGMAGTSETSSSTSTSSLHFQSDATVPAPLTTTEFDIVQHSVKDTLLIVSSLLSLMVHKNDSQYNPSVDPITLFHSRAVPRISIESYLARILQFIPFTNEVLLNVLVYLDRIGGLSGMEMVGAASEEVSGGSGGSLGSSAALDECTDRLFGKVAAVASPIATKVVSSSSSSLHAISSEPSSTSTLQSSASASVSVSCPASSLNTTSTSSSRSSPPHHPPRSISSTHACSASSSTTPLSYGNSFSASKKNLQDPDCLDVDMTARPVDSNSSNPTSVGLNSDPPMIQKRGREQQEGQQNQHEQHKQHQPLCSNLTAQQQQQKQQQHPPHPTPQSQHEDEEDVDLQHAPKRARLDRAPSSPSIEDGSTSTSYHHQHHPSTVATTSTTSTTTIDVQSMPGGSTPAPTPKLATASNGFRINSFNIHRLLITCLMVAAKFTSDLFYSNARYAKVGGLSLLELNQLELEFLFTTRFELNVKVEELQRVGNALLRFKNREMVPVQQARVQQQAQIQRQLQQQQQQELQQQQYRGQQQLQAATDSTSGSGSEHGDVVDTAMRNGGQVRQQQQQLLQKTGRFSIPSPTSPRSGPMSDRAAQTPASAPSSSLSSSSSSISATVTSTATVTSSGLAGENGATVVVVSGSRPQRAQLLSPPEEKHSWTENEVQISDERIDDQVQDQKGPSSSSSSSLSASPSFTSSSR